MFGYFKGQPSEYVMKVVNGETVAEGLGLSFSYLTYKTSVVVVPATNIDAGFVFNEVTSNFQSVTIQGQITFRIADPKQAAGAMNFSVHPRHRHRLSDEADRLPQRISNVVQTSTRSEVRSLDLEQVLKQSEQIAATVREKLKTDPGLAQLGVEVIGLHFVSVAATPEVARALEAEYREGLLRRADEAIYGRRGAAVEEERKIKERELETDIAMESGRERLLELAGANELREAQNRGRALEEEAAFRARALEQELTAYGVLDAKTLLALGIKNLGDNASKVGNLTITSEVLAALLDSNREPAS